MSDSTTQLPVIVRLESSGQFFAQPVGIPEIQAVAATPAEALEQVRQALLRWPGKVYSLSVPASSIPPGAGHAKGDPDFQGYVDEIEKFRRDVEARECSSTSSTPTT